ncbi:MAG: hypothetical protein HYS13_10385 [Planctomycetia bacterium]|nr:hypothetical protein [Planctomycetia bacterium]
MNAHPSPAVEAAPTSARSLGGDDTACTARVVLLGASNLTRGISTVAALSQATLGRRLEIFAALGHGRSFGLTSRLLVRGLPGILQSGLWKALDERPAARTFALVTDVGNDLLYGVPPERTIEWVAECLDRLAGHNARTVLTLPPTCNLVGLSKARYYFFRTVFFPSCRIPYEEMVRRAATLDAGLRRLGAERSLPTPEPRAEWYGLDPIHIKLRKWRSAWGALLSLWSDEAAPSAGPSLRRWLYLRWLAPERRTIFGRERTRPQPAGKLQGGGTVWFY